MRILFFISIAFIVFYVVGVLVMIWVLRKDVFGDDDIKSATAINLTAFWPVLIYLKLIG